jgi:LmbE family N-acetylglucosaminyl deacetylase
MHTKGELPLARLKSEKSILAIFAHPDDELFIAPILSRYAKEGVECTLAIVTDGRFGITEHMNGLAGDELAALRKQELHQSTHELGIKDPIMFEFEDGFSHKTPVLLDALEHISKLFHRVHELILDLKPTALITFGPDGVYGHPDHTTVGNVVTSVFQHQRFDFPCQLYYPGINREILSATLPDNSNIIERGTFPLDTQYLPVKISFSDQDTETAKSSLCCHKSQFTNQQIEKMVKRLYDDRKVYFRPWNGEFSNENSLI